MCDTSIARVSSVYTRALISCCAVERAQYLGQKTVLRNTRSRAAAQHLSPQAKKNVAPVFRRRRLLFRGVSFFGEKMFLGLFFAAGEEMFFGVLFLYRRQRFSFFRHFLSNWPLVEQFLGPFSYRSWSKTISRH